MLYVLVQMELDIAFLANVIGESSIAARLMEASQARQKAINSVFWNEEMGQWLDYWLQNDSKCKVVFTLNLAISWFMKIAIYIIFSNFFILVISGCLPMGGFEPKPKCICFKLYTIVDSVV